MIIETRPSGPSSRTASSSAARTTREAVLIDPGDEVAALLAFAEREQLTIRHILLTHAHVDHVTGVAAAKRALGVPVYLHRDDLFLYERAVAAGAMFGLQVEPQPPIDRVLRAGRGHRVRRLRGAAAPHARPLSGRRLPADWPERREPARTCSSATRCSPGRSGAPTCPAATTPR